MAKTIYIAGPILNNPDYRDDFGAAESYLSWHGYIVLNPSNLPEGMPADRYMPICLAMLNAADGVYFLPGYLNSAGAMLERHMASYQGKELYFHLEELTGTEATS